MLGSMVSTHLGATQTYCLHPLSTFLDTDGSLLVQSPELKGGFNWGARGYLTPCVPSSTGTTIDTSSL
jgi:hypothetical protein